jgi:hypothetical protein
MLINTTAFTEVKVPPMLVIKGNNGNASILFLDNMGGIATSSAQAGLTTQPNFLQDVSQDEFLHGMGGVSNTKRTVYAPTSRNYATSSWINQAAVTSSAGFDFQKNQFWMARTSGSNVSFVYADYSRTSKTGSAGTIVTPSITGTIPRLVNPTTNFYRGKILLGHSSSSGILGGGRLLSYDTASNTITCVTASFSGMGWPTQDSIRNVTSPCFNVRTNEMMYSIASSTVPALYTITRSDFDNFDPTNTGVAAPNALISPSTASASGLAELKQSLYIPYLHEVWTSIFAKNLIYRYKLPTLYFGDTNGSWTNTVISGSVTGLTNAAGGMTLCGGIERYM